MFWVLIRIGEAILISTHNIGFYEDLTKIIFHHQICTLSLLLKTYAWIMSVKSFVVPYMFVNVTCKDVCAIVHAKQTILHKGGSFWFSKIQVGTQRKVFSHALAVEIRCVFDDIYLMIIQRQFLSNLHKNLCCGCSLELPRQGDSNKNPQHRFLWRNKQNYHLSSNIIKYAPYFFCWTMLTIWYWIPCTHWFS